MEVTPVFILKKKSIIPLTAKFNRSMVQHVYSFFYFN
jgi:hypothetical protein